MKIKFFEKKVITVVSLIAVLLVGTIFVNRPKADTYQSPLVTDPAPISEFFTDPNLAAKVAAKLKQSVSYVVTQAELAQINELDASALGIQDIQGVQYLIGVRNLNLDVNNISNLNLLRYLPSLETLSLHQNAITDIEPLVNLNLKSLTISSNKITDLTPLQGKLGLTYLNVSKNDGIRLSDISTNTSLQTLIADEGGISDVSVLVSLTNLSHLSLMNNQVSDISVFQSMPSLSKLYLDSNLISNIAPLATQTGLRELSFDNNNVSDISVVSTFNALALLKMSNNPITSLENVRNLTGLTHLQFNATGIQNIEAVSNLTNLNYLSFNLSRNKVTTISPVTNLTNLENLHFNGNAIQDLTPLLGLTKLKALWMSDNQITSLEPLVNIAGLQNVYFNSNQISDISVFRRMNTSGLNIINGSSNYITDISPLSSISRAVLSVVNFEHQRYTIAPQETQRSYIAVPNVTIDLDGVSKIQSFKALEAGAVPTTKTLLADGAVAPTGELTWDSLAVGEYTAAYQVEMNIAFKYTRLRYSLIATQDASVRSAYYVSYDANGGELGAVPVDNTPYVKGENSIVLEQGTMDHETATFIEWNTEADGSGTSYNAGDDILNLQSSMTLYAIWKPDPIIIIPTLPPTVAPKEEVVVVYSEPIVVETGDTAQDTAPLYVVLAISMLVMVITKRKKEVE